MSSHQMSFDGALPFPLYSEFLDVVDGVRLVQRLTILTGWNFATELEEVEAEARYNGGRRKGTKKFLEVTRGKITTDELVKALRAEGYDELANKICALTGQPTTGAVPTCAAAAAAAFPPTPQLSQQPGQQQPVVHHVNITNNYAPISVQHGGVNNVENIQQHNSGDEDGDEEQEEFEVAVESNGSSTSEDVAPTSSLAGEYNAETSRIVCSQFREEENIGESRVSGADLIFSPGNPAADDHFHQRLVDSSPELAVTNLGIELRSDIYSEKLMDASDLEETDLKVVGAPDGEVTFFKRSAICDSLEPCRTCRTSAGLNSVADTVPQANSEPLNVYLESVSDDGCVSSVLSAVEASAPSDGLPAEEVEADASGSNTESLRFNPAHAFMTGDELCRPRGQQNSEMHPAELIDGDGSQNGSLESSEAMDEHKERNGGSSINVGNEAATEEKTEEFNSSDGERGVPETETSSSSSRVEGSSSTGTNHEHSFDNSTAYPQEQTLIDNLQNGTTEQMEIDTTQRSSSGNPGSTIGFWVQRCWHFYSTFCK